MRLYNNRPSPYGRKVLIAAHEKSLMKRITLFQTDPWSDPSALLAVTPIGKVPALVTDDGAVITDSTIISEYFDAVGHGRALIGADRFEVMARVALMQGLIDAAFATVIERRRPAERRWDDWVSRQHRAIARTLDIVAPVDDRFDLGDIALACALAYLDFRLPEIVWRCAHRTLAAWLDEVGRRPSMQATAP
jgi:glutathione S-transferase